MSVKRAALRAAMMAAVLGAGVILPAGVASAAPAHTCTDGDFITHGGFSTLGYGGATCTVSDVKIGWATDRVPHGDGFSQFTAINSTIGTVEAYFDYDQTVTLNSSTVGNLDAAAAFKVTISHSSVRKISGEFTYLTAVDSSVDRGFVLAVDYAANLTDMRFGGSVGIYANSYYENDGQDVYENRPAVTAANTHIDGSMWLTEPRAVQLCDVHTTANLTIAGDDNSLEGGSVTDSPTVLGGFVDPKRLCGNHPTVRVDGNLTFADGRGTPLAPIQLRHVAIGGALICNRAHVTFEDVTVKGVRVTHC